jgi:16S rRNA (guanine527-N7)-methyltransferase
VAWKGRRDPVEEADGAAAAAQLAMEPRAVTRVQPFAEARDRHLYLYLKVGSTPNGYPRRPGMASKRPLRAST